MSYRDKDILHYTLPFIGDRVYRFIYRWSRLCICLFIGHKSQPDNERHCICNYCTRCGRQFEACLFDGWKGWAR
jgi:hypothetical protein